MGVGILRQRVLSQVIVWCDAALFLQYFLSKLSVLVSIVCISLTFHIKQHLWLNIHIHYNSFFTIYKQSNSCNEMCGLPLTINGSYKSPIYLSSRLMLSISLSLSLQWAAFRLSCPVILINSVYLSAVITENGPYNFNRQSHGVEKLTLIFLCSFFSRSPNFSKLEPNCPTEKNDFKVKLVSS